MRISELVGNRFFREADESVLFEGPLAGKRTTFAGAEVNSALVSIKDFLDSQTVPRQLRVGVLSNQQIETYLAVFGAVMAGATFVPLNPKFPVARLSAITELAELDVVLCDSSTEGLLGSLNHAIPSCNVTTLIRADEVATHSLCDIDVSLSDIAYVMFTSGSTGVPKGVPISYGNLASYVRGISALLDIPKGWRFTQFFDLSFDLSMHDIFVSQYAHGTLVAPSSIDLMMPGAYVAREKINIWFSVPILGAQLGNGLPKEGFGGLSQILFCGEALPMETVRACRSWLADSGSLWNLYGPTEATIAFTASDVTHSKRHTGSASIGRPFGGNITAIMNATGTVVTDTEAPFENGIEGELLLGGPQVFAGYSTSATSPFVLGENSQIFYRSGDLVRVDDEGIYYRGRIDSQVKFRGYRIELGEIEAVVRERFNLKSVAVVLVGEHVEASLAMFYTQSEAQGFPDVAQLTDVLPAYMIPGQVFALEQMPVNQNGKIDRKSLAQHALR